MESRTDYKVATAASKPKLGHIPFIALLGVARVLAYGARKYAPGNFLLATMEDDPGERYVSAALRHIKKMQCGDGQYTPTSLSAIDEESGLPEIDHVITGFVMLRTILIKEGVLRDDPGVGK